MQTITAAEARTQLSKKLAEFRARGIDSELLIFDHRRAEGVVLPYALYQDIEDAIDQARLNADTVLTDKIDEVVADPGIAVKVPRRRRAPASG